MPTQKSQTAGRRHSEEEVEEAPSTISVKFTRLTQDSAEVLEVKPGTTISDILEEKKVPERAEVRVKRGDETLTVSKDSELQDGDFIVVIPHSIQGGRRD